MRVPEYYAKIRYTYQLHHKRPAFPIESVTTWKQMAYEADKQYGLC